MHSGAVAGEVDGETGFVVCCTGLIKYTLLDSLTVSLSARVIAIAVCETEEGEGRERRQLWQVT